jgi:hypothetical protein
VELKKFQMLEKEILEKVILAIEKMKEDVWSAVNAIGAFVDKISPTCEVVNCIGKLWHERTRECL